MWRQRCLQKLSTVAEASTTLEPTQGNSNVQSLGKPVVTSAEVDEVEENVDKNPEDKNDAESDDDD